MIQVKVEAKVEEGPFDFIYLNLILNLDLFFNLR